MLLEKGFNCQINSEDITLHLVVDYNGDFIDEIISVSVTDYHSGEDINLMNVFSMYFPDELDNIIDSVNWHQLYREKKQNLQN